MALSFKTSAVEIDGKTWVTRQLDSRDHFPDDAEKINIGQAVWGADVPESLWPLTGILWPSGILLAELVSKLRLDDKKILEIGCGIALASLVLKQQGFDVTASDYNPFAGELLRDNAALNQIDPPKFLKLSWQDDYHGELYDVIIGSDVLYEPGCSKEVARFLDSALKPQGVAIFVDPGRAHVRKFETTLESAGFRCEVEWPTAGQKTRILRISRDLKLESR